MSVMPSAQSMRVAIPPIVREPIAVMMVAAPMVSYVVAPTVPMGDAIGISSVPVLDITDLVMPTVVHHVDLIVVDVNPRWPVVNDGVANVDIAQIDGPIVARSSRQVGSIPGSVSGLSR